MFLSLLAESDAITLMLLDDVHVTYSKVILLARWLQALTRFRASFWQRRKENLSSSLERSTPSMKRRALLNLDALASNAEQWNPEAQYMEYQ